MSDVVIVIPDGNAVELVATWTDKAGEPEDPASVRYQVFDERTSTAVSDIVDVPEPAASMTFTVPGADLPGDSTKRRGLSIQVEATFAAGDIHTVTATVYVARRFAFAA